MRIEGSYAKDDAEHPFWVDLRGPAELSGADEDAFKSVYESALGDFEIDLDLDEDMELSDDGVSMMPKKRKVKISLSLVNQQRDLLLSRLITDWSFADVPLPYTGLSRERLPLAACKALDGAIAEHKRVLNGTGPDPKGETTSGSSNGSRAASQHRRTG